MKILPFLTLIAAVSAGGRQQPPQKNFQALEDSEDSEYIYRLTELQELHKRIAQSAFPITGFPTLPSQVHRKPQILPLILSEFAGAFWTSGNDRKIPELESCECIARSRLRKSQTTRPGSLLQESWASCSSRLTLKTFWFWRKYLFDDQNAL